MALKGNLHDMGVADLVQQSCQDRKTAQLSIHHNNQQAVLYFKDGQVAHASMGSLSGEDVIYAILAWEEGLFELEKDVEPPVVSIQRKWGALLMEGARRIDETRAAAEAAALEEQNKQSEVNEMSELQNILKAYGNEVNGYMAAAVVGSDGISIATDNKSSKADSDAVGAQSALLVKLVDTSAAKMQVGSLEDTIVTTDDALILIRFLENKHYFLVTLVDKRGASLGNLRLMSRIYSERVGKAIPR